MRQEGESRKLISTSRVEEPHFQCRMQLGQYSSRLLAPPPYSRTGLHRLGSCAFRQGLRLRRPTFPLGRSPSLPPAMRVGRGLLPLLSALQPGRYMEESGQRKRRRTGRTDQGLSNSSPRSRLHHGYLPHCEAQGRGRPRRIPYQARHLGNLRRVAAGDGDREAVSNTA